MYSGRFIKVDQCLRSRFMESKQENQEMNTHVPKRLVFRLPYSENIHLKNELRESGFVKQSLEIRS